MEKSINNEKKVFMSSKKGGEELLIHSKSDNSEIMIGNDTYEIIQVLFNIILNRIDTK